MGDCQSSSPDVNAQNRKKRMKKRRQARKNFGKFFLSPSSNIFVFLQTDALIKNLVLLSKNDVMDLVVVGWISQIKSKRESGTWKPLLCLQIVVEWGIQHGMRV